MSVLVRFDGEYADGIEVLFARREFDLEGCRRLDGRPHGEDTFRLGPQEIGDLPPAGLFSFRGFIGRMGIEFDDGEVRLKPQEVFAELFLKAIDDADHDDE